MNQTSLSTSTGPSTIEHRRGAVLPPLLVTVEQACQMLGISRTTLYHLDKRGIVHGVRFGGAVRYRYSDLCDLVDAVATYGELAQRLAAPTASGRQRSRTPKARAGDRRTGASP